MYRVHVNCFSVIDFNLAFIDTERVHRHRMLILVLDIARSIVFLWPTLLVLVKSCRLSIRCDYYSTCNVVFFHMFTIFMDPSLRVIKQALSWLRYEHDHRVSSLLIINAIVALVSFVLNRSVAPQKALWLR